MAEIKITNTSTNEQSVVTGLPDWALEDTQTKLLAAINKDVGYNKESKESLAKLVGHLTDANKNEKKNQKEADSDRDKAQRTLDDINKNGKKKNKDGSVLESASDQLGNVMKFAATATGTAFGSIIGGFASLISTSYRLGNVLGDLSMVGVGFDTVANETINTIAGLNALGMTSKEAAGLMAEYSGVIQTVGKPEFLNLTREFARITGFGADFGMTMKEAATVMAEELEERQQLGILGKVSDVASAKRTQELYKQQLKNTQILGKSITDIRDAGGKTLADQATVKLAFIRATHTMGDDAAEAFRVATATNMSKLSAIGVSQEVIDQMGMAMFDVNAFQSQGAQAMREALLATGTSAGLEIEQSLVNINKLVKQGDGEEAAKAQAALQKKFLNLGEEMAADGGKGAVRFQSMLATLGQSNPMVEMIATMQPDLLRAAKNLVPGNIADDLSQMAKSSQAFDNAIAQVKGSFEGIQNAIGGAFGHPFSFFATALTEGGHKVNDYGQLVDKNGEVFRDSNKKIITSYDDLNVEQKKQADNIKKSDSLMTVFNDAMNDIRLAFVDLLGPVTEGEEEVKSFADTIRDKVGPIIKTMGENIADFIRDFDFALFWENTKATFENVKDGFVILGTVVGTVASGLKWLAEFIYDFTGNKETKSAGVVLERNGEAVPVTEAQKTKVNAQLEAMRNDKVGMQDPTNKAEYDALTKALNASVAKTNSMKEDMPEITDAEIMKKAGDEGAKTFFERLKVLNIGALIAGGFAVKMLKNKLFGGGGSGNTGKSGVGSDNGKGLGKSISNIGKGIGKGLGGMIAGFFSAFSVATVKGAAMFAATIAAASLGLGAAALILGKSLPILADGLRSFEGIDGMNLIKIGGAMAALGAGLAAFGAGAVAGAVGGTISSLLDLLPGKSPLEKLRDFSDADVGDIEKIKSNADALVTFGSAMAAFGGGEAAASVGNVVGNVIGFVTDLFGSDNPLDKVKKFGEADINADGVTKNATALGLFNNAISGFNGTVNEGMSETAVASTIAHVNGLSDAYERLSSIDMSNIDKVIMPQTPAGTPDVGMNDSLKQELGFADNDTTPPTPASADTNANNKQPTTKTEMAGANGKTVEELLAMQIKATTEIATRNEKKLNELISAIGQV